MVSIHCAVHLCVLSDVRPICVAASLAQDASEKSAHRHNLTDMVADRAFATAVATTANQAAERQPYEAERKNGDLWRLCLHGGVLRAEPVEPKIVRHCVRSEETEREWVVSRGTDEQQVNARKDAECNTKEVSAKIVAAKFGAGAGEDQCVDVKGSIMYLTVDNSLQSDASSEANHKSYCDDELTKAGNEKVNLETRVTKCSSKCEIAVSTFGIREVEAAELRADLGEELTDEGHSKRIKCFKQVRVWDGAYDKTRYTSHTSQDGPKGQRMSTDDGRTDDGDHRHGQIKPRNHARNDALCHTRQRKAGGTRKRDEAKEIWIQFDWEIEGVGN